MNSRPPEGHSIFAPFVNTFLFNLTEQPAISVNCGLTSDDLPIGLQIFGRRFDDFGTIQLARAYEKVRGDMIFPGISTSTERH